MKKYKSSKGLSLVELMVAILISSIVLLMATTVITSSYQSYNKENIKSNIQNTLQLSMGNIADAVMEGNELTISGTSLETSVYDATAQEYENKTGKNITYDSAGQMVYMCNKRFSDLTGSERKGCILAEKVTNYTIAIDDSCKRIDESNGEILYYINPVKLKVSMKITHKTYSGDYEQTIVMRNKIDHITVDGTVYEVR